jgi:3-hydroxyisobutyrate dehydrogenase-like beta-hydroxyacid dehydrogenase
MGIGVARCLSDAGYPIQGCDISEDTRRIASAFCSRVSEDPASVVEACEVIFTCLHTETTHAIVEKSGSLARRILVDLGTSTPELSRRLEMLVERRGGYFIEAPMSGGPPAAVAGNLVLFVAGKQEIVEPLLPLVRTLGKATYLGPTGNGQLAKLINNQMVGIHFAAAAEGFAMARAVGLPADLLGPLFIAGAANSWVIENFWGKMASGDFDPRGTVSIHARDLKLALAEARAFEAVAPLTEASSRLFEEAETKGLGGFAQHVLVKLWDLPKKD